MTLRLLPYALLLAGGVFVLELGQRALWSGRLEVEIAILAAALAFAALGLWAGAVIFRSREPRPAFERNDAAIRSLGLTGREMQVLAALADGLSNKEIARRLDVSPNTVKSQIASLYRKLGVSRRMAAVETGRALSLIA